MRRSWKQKQPAGILLAGFLSGAILQAQPQPADAGGQVTFDASVNGSSSELGHITRFDGAVGYIFNRNWSASVGVPVYILRPSSTAIASTGSANVEGLGNVYAQIRLDIPGETLHYASTVTGTAPTGDREQGLSIGHATIDWTNTFDRTFGRFTPFGEIGIANAVSDTMIFVRPYIATGFVTHVQGGTLFRAASWMNLGASGYAIVPAGTQTVTSRVIGRGQAGVIAAEATGAGPGGMGQGGPRGPGGPRGVFETTTVTTGTAEIARDQGMSTWVTVSPHRTLNFFAGYTRSTQFDLNVFFFGTSWHLPVAVRR